MTNKILSMMCISFKAVLNLVVHSDKYVQKGRSKSVFVFSKSDIKLVGVYICIVWIVYKISGFIYLYCLAVSSNSRVCNTIFPCLTREKALQ